MIQVECIGSTHGILLSELWYNPDDRVTRQAAGNRQQDVRWLQVRPLIHSTDSPASILF